MNIAILSANILTLFAFVLHTFVGDKELKVNEPSETSEDKFLKLGQWILLLAISGLIYFGTNQ